jgi:Alpha/beta hydrolase family
VSVDCLPLLKEIQVPTLVVAGREDVYTPLALAEQLCECIPAAELTVIENAGHMPNLEQPDAFNEAMGFWLLGLRPPKGKSDNFNTNAGLGVNEGTSLSLDQAASS